MTFLRSTLYSSLLICLSLAVAGCGDGNGSLEPDPDREDGSLRLTLGEKLCSPNGTLSEYPAIYDGSMPKVQDVAPAIAVSTGECATESAPFGVEVPGTESVVQLTNLEPGAEYVVRLFSQSDLAIYTLVTEAPADCDSTQTVLEEGACLMFSDDTVQPPERGSFIAPDTGYAAIVIDYFLAADPVVSDFSMDVYQAECDTDDQCTGGNSFCVDQRCVACSTSFDCSEAATPICDLRTNSCVAGDDTCSNDDEAEGFDDGPAGATDVTPDAITGTATASGQICNSPSTEVDYLSFVAAAGESFTIELDWDDAPLDLDFGIFDASGRQLGASLWRYPEVIELTHLPAGTYYAQVNLFGGSVSVGQAYSVTVTRDSAVGCASTADCADSYDTQLYRGECALDGACISIDYEDPAAVGSSCDSSSDCDSGRCSSFSFTSDADSRAVCTSTCTTDDECGADVCTDYLLDNMCVQKCTSDDQCAVLIGNMPSCAEGDTACNLNPPTWTHLVCETESGKCQFPE